MWIKIGKRFALNGSAIESYQKKNVNELVINTSNRSVKMTFRNTDDGLKELSTMIAVLDQIVSLDKVTKLNINPTIE